MDIQITPGLLKGKVTAPSSKSAAHRALICAALADGISYLRNMGDNDDILATMQAVSALGAKLDRTEGILRVEGIGKKPTHAIIDCNESGSTLRFLVPIAAALGVTATFLGKGELPNRPMTPLLSLLREHGVTHYHSGKADEIFTIKGQLTPGIFAIPGNISSQYITGLLFALPLLATPSEIHLTTPLESSGYVDMTLDTLQQFGVKIKTGENRYFMEETSIVKSNDFTIEGDYSGAAFWVAAGGIGSQVTICGLKPDSLQGDQAILSLVETFGAYLAKKASCVTLEKKSTLKALAIDATEIPDLVPILSVIATQAEGTTVITGAARLRIKESDRLYAMTEGLTRLGAQIEEIEDGLIIKGPTPLTGGTVSSFDDHRIAMSLSIAATVASGPVVIQNAQCVDKSYPDFYKDFKHLGGMYHVL